MRHLILTLDFPPQHDGGIARSMDETARALAAKGESVRILTRGSGDEIARHDAAYPAKVTRWWGHHWQKFYPLLLRVHLPAVGREERGAVVHTATWELAPAVQRRAARHDWKVFIHAQGREVANAFASPDRLARLRAAVQAADAVLPISRHVGELVRQAGAPPERIHFIPPAIDARRVQGGRGERFRERLGLGRRPILLTLARLIDRKGQDTVIRALPEIRKAVPDLAYVLAGGGAYRPELEKLARDEGVEKNVIFAGFVPDEEVPDAYAAANAYVMVSREGRESGDIEGFGITYLEASANALPVIGGTSGGTADAVEDGVSGVLVDPTDIRAVGDAIARLFLEPERARSLGEAGKARVERDFSLSTRAERILGISSARGRSD